MVVRRKQIRSLVEALLAEHGIGAPPVPVARIAAALRVELQREPAEDELSGFLYRDRERDLAIIGVNARHPRNRQDFTTAHELGHFLLHDIDEIHVDRQFKVWLRDEQSKEGADSEEREANLFAAELLMPERFLAKDIERIAAVDLMDERVLADLAGRYGVSTQAMTFRLAYL